MFLRAPALAASALVMLTLPACGDPEPACHEEGCEEETYDVNEDVPADCEAIKDACHLKDVGKGEVHECHELAHEGTAAECKAEKAKCVKTCDAAPKAG